MTASMTEKSASYNPNEDGEKAELQKPPMVEFKKDHQHLQIKLIGFPLVLVIILILTSIADIVASYFFYQITSQIMTPALALLSAMLPLLSIPLVLFIFGPRVNHQYITVRALKLGYWQTPFSLFSGHIVNTFDILSFSLEKKQAQAENRSATFDILMHLKNGKIEKICRTRNLEEAFFIEHLLEEHLELSHTNSEAID